VRDWSSVATCKANNLPFSLPFPFCGIKTSPNATHYGLVRLARASQQCFSLTPVQHQPPATSQPNQTYIFHGSGGPAAQHVRRLLRKWPLITCAQALRHTHTTFALRSGLLVSLHPYGTWVPHAFTDPLSSAPNRGSCRPGLVLHYTTPIKKNACKCDDAQGMMVPYSTMQGRASFRWFASEKGGFPLHPHYTKCDDSEQDPYFKNRSHARFRRFAPAPNRKASGLLFFCCCRAHTYVR
jgi:hypothetical protein